MKRLRSHFVVVLVSVCSFVVPSLAIAQGNNPGNSLAQQVAALQVQMADAQSRLNAAETRLSSAESRLSSAESRLTSTESRLTTAESRLSSAESRLTAVEALADALKTENLNQAAQITSLQAETASAGTVITYAAEAPPAGYLECDGSPVLRASYPRLFAAIGTAWGAGDGASTFNLPDMRGLFLRGWSHASSPAFDPDRAARTQLNAGGASGDHVGSLQIDQFQSHFHNVHSAALNVFGPYSPVSGGNSLGVDLAGFTLAVGGNETRPRNVAVMYAIKY